MLMGDHEMTGGDLIGLHQYLLASPINMGNQYDRAASDDLVLLTGRRRSIWPRLEVSRQSGLGARTYGLFRPNTLA